MVLQPEVQSDNTINTALVNSFDHTIQLKKLVRLCIKVEFQAATFKFKAALKLSVLKNDLLSTLELPFPKDIELNQLADPFQLVALSRADIVSGAFIQSCTEDLTVQVARSIRLISVEYNRNHIVIIVNSPGSRIHLIVEASATALVWDFFENV